MKITQTWHRHDTSIYGYGISVITVYTSFDAREIDAIQDKLTPGMIVMDTDKPAVADVGLYTEAVYD